MNHKHQKTLRAIFETPTRSDIKWRKVKSLLKAVDAKIANGRGSRRWITLNGVVGIIQLCVHEPHSTPLGKCDVEAFQDLFTEAGITPDTINGGK
jgi:hypothetical protein